MNIPVQYPNLTADESANRAAKLIDKVIDEAVRGRISDCLLTDVQAHGELVHYVDGSSVFLYQGEPLARLHPISVEHVDDGHNCTVKVIQSYERL